jgi:hypothetical protein
MLDYLHINHTKLEANILLHCSNKEINLLMKALIINSCFFGIIRH